MNPYCTVHSTNPERMEGIHGSFQPSGGTSSLENAHDWVVLDANLSHERRQGRGVSLWTFWFEHTSYLAFLSYCSSGFLLVTYWWQDCIARQWLVHFSTPFEMHSYTKSSDLFSFQLSRSYFSGSIVSHEMGGWRLQSFWIPQQYLLRKSCNGQGLIRI